MKDYLFTLAASTIKWARGRLARNYQLHIGMMFIKMTGSKDRHEETSDGFQREIGRKTNCKNLNHKKLKSIKNVLRVAKLDLGFHGGLRPPAESLSGYFFVPYRSRLDPTTLRHQFQHSRKNQFLWNSILSDIFRLRLPKIHLTQNMGGELT